MIATKDEIRERNEYCELVRLNTYIAKFGTHDLLDWLCKYGKSEVFSKSSGTVHDYLIGSYNITSETSYYKIPDYITIAKRMAYNASEHSTCIRVKIGACVYDNGNFYVGTNGMQNKSFHSVGETNLFLSLLGLEKSNIPLSCKEISELVKKDFCRRGKVGVFLIEGGLPRRFCPSYCAERNALRHISGDGSDGIELYTDILPCYGCSERIAKLGLKRVFIGNSSHNNTLDISDIISLDILKQSGIEVVKVKDDEG